MRPVLPQNESLLFPNAVFKAIFFERSIHSSNNIWPITFVTVIWIFLLQLKALMNIAFKSLIF